MTCNFLLMRLISIICVVLIGCNANLVPLPSAYTINIQFVNYIQSGLPEQDVFVQDTASRDKSRRASGHTVQDCDPSNQFAPGFLQPWMLPPPLSNPCAKDIYVERARPQDALLPSFLAKPVYATTKVIPHDPYRVGVSAPGPFPAGDVLGFTWGEWLAARGSGTYSLMDGHAQLDLSFEHLIPNASYSLWCGRETPPPNYSSSDSPCGTGDGTQNQFRADAAGRASLPLPLKPLVPSNSEATTVLSLTYDRVVPTADGDLGGYGLNNHVQLFFKFPQRSLPERLTTDSPSGGHVLSK